MTPLIDSPVVQPLSSVPGPDATETGDGPPRPCRLQARAWWGDELLGDTFDALRMDREGQAPLLWFPVADVRLDLLRADHDPVTAVPGSGAAGMRTWSTDLPPTPTGATGAAASDTWLTGSDERGEADGHAIVLQLLDPGPDRSWASDHVTFDHDRVRVEVVDGADDDPPEDITITRWPTWGDASDLIDLLDVRPDGEHRYVSTRRDNWQRPVVEASQMLGQAIVAASREAGGRRVVSAHMSFTRAADTDRPIEVDLDVVASGRTFSTVVATVTQGGRTCAVGTFLLDDTADDVVRHAVAPPAVPGPLDSPPLDMGVTGRDLRVVDGAYTSDPEAPVGPPELDAWIRFRDVPDDPALHAALLAQFTGHFSIAAALRPHAGIGQMEAHRSLSTAINAIAISFHGDVRADRWMLYHHLSTFAGDGMSHSECRVHDEKGGLVASFTVDAMIRRFAARSAVDAGRSL